MALDAYARRRRRSSSSSTFVIGLTVRADMDSAEQLYDRRVARILTSDLPRYFAVISRVLQESHYIGADGLVISSSVTQQVQVVFPPGALTKSIPVGLQVRYDTIRYSMFTCAQKVTR